jgi:hypothetical protein
MSRKPKVLNANETYTFAKYFDLPFTIDDILLDLDCTHHKDRIELPYCLEALDLADLERRINRNLKLINLNSEIARREAIVGPILQEICDRLDHPLNIEYAVSVSNWLRGSLDYYIRTPIDLLVIEAKRDNLDSGFTQLAVELIALDQWTDSEASLLYGAVTSGTDWKFGVFCRRDRHITQDLKLYRIPEELETLYRILLGILQSCTP